MSADISEAIAAMILERQQARTSEYAQRTSALAEFKADLRRRRDAGLKRRHEVKLARNHAAQPLV